jgi:HEPN domain-containing protein
MSGPDDAVVRGQVQGWLAVAEADRRAALACLAAAPPLPAVAAFHCQQVAEKLLKGFLVYADVTFRKTHDLRELGDAVAAKFPDLASAIGPMEDWTIWNVAYRYPTEELPEPEPTAEELQQALEVLDHLAARLRSLLEGPSPASGPDSTC